MTQTGRYSRVSRRIWNDEKVRKLSKPQPNAQSLFIRLLTGPELTCIPGLFQAWESGLAESLGWPMKGFRESFQELFRAGLVEASWGHGLVWIPNAIHHNEPKNSNMVKAWADVWPELPDCQLKDRAILALHDWALTKDEPIANAFLNGLPNGLPNSSGIHSCDNMPTQEQEQEQEQDQEQEQEIPQPPRQSKRSKRETKETYLPDDWAPTEEHQKFAAKHGLNLDIQVFKFRGHYAGKTAASWNGRFATWLGHAAEFAIRDGKVPANQGHLRFDGNAAPAIDVSGDSRFA